MKGHLKISPVSNFCWSEELRWMGFALAFTCSPDAESVLKQNAAWDSRQDRALILAGIWELSMW